MDRGNLGDSRREEGAPALTSDAVSYLARHTRFLSSFVPSASAGGGPAPKPPVLSLLRAPLSSPSRPIPRRVEHSPGKPFLSAVSAHAAEELISQRAAQALHRRRMGARVAIMLHAHEDATLGSSGSAIIPTPPRPFAQAYSESARPPLASTPSKAGPEDSRATMDIASGSLGPVAQAADEPARAAAVADVAFVLSSDVIRKPVSAVESHRTGYRIQVPRSSVAGSPAMTLPSAFGGPTTHHPDGAPDPGPLLDSVFVVPYPSPSSAAPLGRNDGTKSGGAKGQAVVALSAPTVPSPSGIVPVSPSAPPQPAVESVALPAGCVWGLDAQQGRRVVFDIARGLAWQASVGISSLQDKSLRLFEPFAGCLLGDGITVVRESWGSVGSRAGAAALPATLGAGSRESSVRRDLFAASAATNNDHFLVEALASVGDVGEAPFGQKAPRQVSTSLHRPLFSSESPRSRSPPLRGKDGPTLLGEGVVPTSMAPAASSAPPFPAGTKRDEFDASSSLPSEIPNVLRRRLEELKRKVSQSSRP